MELSPGFRGDGLFCPCLRAVARRREATLSMLRSVLSPGPHYIVWTGWGDGFDGSAPGSLSKNWNDAFFGVLPLHCSKNFSPTERYPHVRFDAGEGVEAGTASRPYMTIRERCDRSLAAVPIFLLPNRLFTVENRYTEKLNEYMLYIMCRLNFYTRSSTFAGLGQERFPVNVRLDHVRTLRVHISFPFTVASQSSPK